MGNLHCRAGGDRPFFFLFLYVVFFNVLRSLVDVHPKSDPYPRFRREGNWSLFRFGWDSNRDRAGIVLGIGKSFDCWEYVGRGLGIGMEIGRLFWVIIRFLC